ncbi:MAG: WG repeat-containing protein [Xanthobacteraceae bacterium]|nr:WG repeat-containing protein [Xanthobacteraceae bacterium]
MIVAVLVPGALAQEKQLEPTPAGMAILQSGLAVDGQPLADRPGPTQPITFPLAMCTFPGGLCGAVRRDGTVAVSPRYDWIGTFSDNRAAVRLGGLYGFVDEDGREIVRPQYRIVDDYKFGFAQIDVDGKSGLINRDGKMVIAPKYGSIRAIAPDRFRVSETRQLGGWIGGEDFSGTRVAATPDGGVSIGLLLFEFRNSAATGIIDMSGQWIEPPGAPWAPTFDKTDPSIRWVRNDKLWGLARADGTWLIEPKFQQGGALTDGLARVTLNGKAGFIDRKGIFVIAPVFDQASAFKPGLGRTSVERGGISGVIDKTGAWVFQTNYQQIHPAIALDKDNNASAQFGWNFREADRWGLLDLDGHVVLGAEFDQPVERCHDGRLVAYKNKEWLYYKADGDPLQPPAGRLIDAWCGSAPPYTLKIGDKFGLVGADFNPLTAVHFDAIARAGPAARNVKIDCKWGRVALDGSWLLVPKFDYLSSEADSFVASMDGKRGFMRSDGSWLIEPRFEAAARRRDDDTAFVTIAGATGMMRLKDQSFVIPPRPGILCDIDHAIMSEADGKRVILSPTGETWIDIGAERIGTNLDFGLLTFLRNGKWGLVDTAGQVMVEPRFDEPVYFAPTLRGVAWAKRDGIWCAIDRRGQSVPDIACTDASPMGPTRRFECKVEP